MFLVPLMKFNKLISDFRCFKIDMAPDIQVSKNTMNLFDLILPLKTSIPAIKITHHQLFFISAMFLKQILISPHDQFLISGCNTDKLNHFMDHDRFPANFLEIYLKQNVQERCY